MAESGEQCHESEAVKARLVKAPIRPSDVEVEEHMLTHLPFRAWCKHCVRGKSKGKRHSVAQRQDHVVPTLAVDYMFMHSTQGPDEEKGMPILVGRDIADGVEGTGMIFARVVPRKGVHPYAVKCLASDIARLGHQRLVLKSDDEPAIVALKEAARSERPERVVMEESPVHDSAWNGAVENTIQQVQGQFRTMKDSLESRIDARIPEDSPIVPWLVMHAAQTINR